jgi:uncharacterized integral membrane protein
VDERALAVLGRGILCGSLPTITSKQYKAKFVAMGCFLITLLYIIGLSAMKPRDAPLAFSGSVVAGTLILGVLCALGVLAGVIVASRVFGPKGS